MGLILIKNKSYSSFYYTLRFFPLMFAFGWALDLFTPAIPYFLKALALDMTTVNMIFCLFFIALGISQLLLIYCLHYIDRYKVAITASCLFCIACICCAWSQTTSQFIVSYLLLAFASGITSITTVTIIKLDFYDQSTTAIYSYLNSFGAISNFVGSILSMTLLLLLSWRFIFILLFIFGIYMLYCSFYNYQRNYAKGTKSSVVAHEKISTTFLVIIKNKRFYAYVWIAVIANCTYLAMAMIVPVILHDYKTSVLKTMITLTMLGIAFWLGSFLAYCVNKYLSKTHDQLLRLGCVLLGATYLIIFIYAYYDHFEYYSFSLLSFIGILNASFLIGPSISGMMDYFKHELDASAGVMMALIFVMTGLLNLGLSLLSHITMCAISFYVVLIVLIMQYPLLKGNFLKKDKKHP